MDRDNVSPGRDVGAVNARDLFLSGATASNPVHIVEVIFLRLFIFCNIARNAAGNVQNEPGLSVGVRGGVSYRAIPSLTDAVDLETFRTKAVLPTKMLQKIII